MSYKSFKLEDEFCMNWDHLYTINDIPSVERLILPLWVFTLISSQEGLYYKRSIHAKYQVPTMHDVSCKGLVRESSSTKIHLVK